VTLAECSDTAIHLDQIYMLCRKLRSETCSPAERQQLKECEKIFLEASRRVKWEMAGHWEELMRSCSRVSH
jgi:hypothetical protein